MWLSVNRNVAPMLVCGPTTQGIVSRTPFMRRRKWPEYVRSKNHSGILNVHSSLNLSLFSASGLNRASENDWSSSSLRVFVSMNLCSRLCRSSKSLSPERRPELPASQ